jgi:DNA-binding NarL/FixJ family response regulator
MRVILVGRPADRDRLRPELVDAGWEIVTEADVAPPASSTPQGVDAIVTASSHLERSQALRDDPVDQAEALTTREREVLALLAEGLANKAIAQALSISDQTVKFHVAAIIAKLGAANRTDAVRRAVRRGLIAL